MHKVEQVGTTNRVRRCIRELRDTVAHGEDPAKLHESQFQQENPSHDQAKWRLWVLLVICTHLCAVVCGDYTWAAEILECTRTTVVGTTKT